MAKKAVVKKEPKKTTKKVTKKVAKKKVAKKVAKKKVAKKKVVTEVDSTKMFATEEETLKFSMGIMEQKMYNEKLNASKHALELLVIRTTKEIDSYRASINLIEQDRKLAIRDYNRTLDAIRVRLGFEGGFGINTNLNNEVITHEAIEQNKKNKNNSKA